MHTSNFEKQQFFFNYGSEYSNCKNTQCTQSRLCVRDSLKQPQIQIHISGNKHKSYWIHSSWSLPAVFIYKLIWLSFLSHWLSPRRCVFHDIIVSLFPPEAPTITQFSFSASMHAQEYLCHYFRFTNLTNLETKSCIKCFEIIQYTLFSYKIIIN